MVVFLSQGNAAPEVERSHDVALLVEFIANEVHDWIIIASTEWRVRMSDNGTSDRRFLCRLGALQLAWDIYSTLELTTIMYRWDIK